MDSNDQIKDVAATPTPGTQDEDTSLMFDTPSMAAVLGMILGTEAIRFSPQLLD